MITVLVTSKTGHAFAQEIRVGAHMAVSDVDKGVGGSDLGLSPHELFLGALGACTAMTLQMVARRKSWDLKEISVTVSEQLVDDPANPGQKISSITEQIEVKGNLTQAELNALEKAAERCPVYKLLTGPKQVSTSLIHRTPPPPVASSQPASGAGQQAPAAGSNPGAIPGNSQ